VSDILHAFVVANLQCCSGNLGHSWILQKVLQSTSNWIWAKLKWDSKWN